VPSISPGVTQNGTDYYFGIQNTSINVPITVRLLVTAYTVELGSGQKNVKYAVTQSAGVPASYTAFANAVGGTTSFAVSSAGTQYIHFTVDIAVTYAVVQAFNDSDGGTLLATITISGLGGEG